LITAAANALGDDGHQRLERIGTIPRLWVKHCPGEDSALTGG
jgi:hypothetical protein